MNEKQQAVVALLLMPFALIFIIKLAIEAACEKDWDARNRYLFGVLIALAGSGWCVFLIAH